MATNSSNSRSRSQNFLSRIPASELKLIRVAVRRNNITTSVSPGPIVRNIDDPKQLIPLVHIRKDQARRPKCIFDRDDILVNPEERSISTDTQRSEPPQSRSCLAHNRSHSGTPRRRSRSRSLSRTADRERQKVSDREDIGERDKKAGDHRISSQKERDRGSDGERDSSLERDRDKRSYHKRPYSREREDERYRGRSRTPLRPGEYRPSRADLRRRSGSRDQDRAHDKYRLRSRRSRSPSPGYSKPSTSRKPSRSPRRSVTPSRDKERHKSRRYESSRSRRSRSQDPNSDRSREKTHSTDKKRREPSPGYKDSSRRRSRTPRYDREKRRSRSPQYNESSRSKSSPGRYERFTSRRHSRSPGRYDGHRPSPDKRGRSPHPPIVTFDRSRSGHRRSRSPAYDRDRGYHKRRRSRSRSPRNRRSRSPRENRDAGYAYYEGIPGGEYWIPGPPIRPGFPGLPRYYPPAFFPRIPGAPIIMPPRIPLVAPYPMPYRQRLPVYNSKQAPRIANPGASGDDTVSTSIGADGGARASTSGEGDSNVTIQNLSETEDNQIQKKAEDEARDGLHEKD